MYYAGSFQDYSQENFFSGLGTKWKHECTYWTAVWFSLDTVNCVTTCAHPFALAKGSSELNVWLYNFTVSTLCVNFICGLLWNFKLPYPFKEWLRV